MGYAASSTFPVTVAGGTLVGGQSATTINVTTNPSGVVTSVGAIQNSGIYSVSPTGNNNGITAVANSPTGGTATGLSLCLIFGGWFDAANQTPLSAAFAPGRVRDQFNAWLKSIVGQVIAPYGKVFLDAVVDVNPYAEDQSNPGCWVSNGTPGHPTQEGLHPTTPIHILTAQAVNTWALGIAP